MMTTTAATAKTAASAKAVASTAATCCCRHRRPSILLIGDSITQQSFGMNGKIGWGSLLASVYQRRADVLARGYFGYNTNHALQILPRILSSVSSSYSASYSYSPIVFCTILFGSNDAVDYGQLQHVPIEQYRKNMKKIIQDVREHITLQQQQQEEEEHLNNISYDGSNSTTLLPPLPPLPPPPPPIIVMTPPPVHEESWAAFKGVEISTRKNNNIRRYGHVVKEVVSELQRQQHPKSCYYEVLDIWELLNGASSEDPNNERIVKYVTDGVHLNEDGNRIIYDGIMNLLKEKFPHVLPMDDSDGDGKYGINGGIPVEEKLWTEMC